MHVEFLFYAISTQTELPAFTVLKQTIGVTTCSHAIKFSL